MTKTLPKIVAVASGKGGVGKTWFSITLAHALARQGRRVLLLDGDLGLANVDVQLGLTPAVDLCQVLSGLAALPEAISSHDTGGFQVIAGRSGCGEPGLLTDHRVDMLLDQLAAMRAAHDHILLDLAAGVSRSVRHMAARADAVFVIATQEPTSLTDAYATLKLLYGDRPDADARLVVNQANTISGGETTADALRRACTSFLHRAPELAGIVRRDPHVPETIRRQALLLERSPHSPAAMDLERIAATL